MNQFNSLKNRKLRQMKKILKRMFMAALSLCALALFGTGCAAPSVTRRIRDRMEAHPEDYRRVQVLPIWFWGYAQTDTSLTTNDVVALSRQAGTYLPAAVVWALREKGYEVVQTGPVLCEDADLNAFDLETRQLLEGTCSNIVIIGPEVHSGQARLKTGPLEGTTNSNLAELGKRLVECRADLLALMESKACFESPDARHKRNKLNWTEGAALMPLFIAAMASGSPAGFPLKPSPRWLAHSLLIVDARTGEVLFSNGRSFPGEDAL